MWFQADFMSTGFDVLHKICSMHIFLNNSPGISVFGWVNMNSSLKSVAVLNIKHICTCEFCIFINKHFFSTNHVLTKCIGYQEEEILNHFNMLYCNSTLGSKAANIIPINSCLDTHKLSFNLQRENEVIWSITFAGCRSRTWFFWAGGGPPPRVLQSRRPGCCKGEHFVFYASPR